MGKLVVFLFGCCCGFFVYCCFCLVVFWVVGLFWVCFWGLLVVVVDVVYRVGDGLEWFGACS